MMKLRLTPLNIVTALGLAFLIMSIFQPSQQAKPVDFNAIYKVLLGALIVVSFISDLIFRFTLKDLKRIWLVEIAFIIITVILILILQK